MAALGRWMCPREVLREARTRTTLPDLSVCDEATATRFIEALLPLPAGARVYLFSDRRRVARLCVEIGKLLGVYVVVIGEEVQTEPHHVKEDARDTLRGTGHCASPCPRPLL